MKKIKIFTRMLLVVIMVFSLGATVFAEETDPSEQTGYTITINNAHNGETYTAYKLLSATYAEEDSTAIAYYYEGEATDELYTILADYFQFDAFVDGKAYVKVVDDDGAEISYADVDVAQLAEDLNAALTRAENPLVITAAGSDVAEGGKAEISVAEKGYYF
ncbi:MAG: hypothetical protein IJM15_00075, partial [Erysipelotrichaceae bacterium]|nr:hypothetical protein [Erysipelotrichaceae bacterium]